MKTYKKVIFGKRLLSIEKNIRIDYYNNIITPVSAFRPAGVYF